jgi:DNA-binding NarL/FixJ family response regulator
VNTGKSILVYVYSADPILHAGLISQLRNRTEVCVVEPPSDVDQAVVAVVATDTVTDEDLRVLRAIQRNSVPRTVLIARDLDEPTVVAAAEAGVSGLVRRADATADHLAHVVCRVATGDGAIPADLVGGLLSHVGRLQRGVLAPRGFLATGLTERETRVLTLAANGDDTATIASKLAYSERTVKNLLHDLTSRLQLRNRTHAVAYAVRQGLI